MVYVSQPLDTVKVKMQTFPELYKGMVSCFVTTFKRDGVVRGLYAGNEYIQTILIYCATVSRILINFLHVLFLNHTFLFIQVQFQRLLQMLQKTAFYLQVIKMLLLEPSDRDESV